MFKLTVLANEAAPETETGNCLTISGELVTQSLLVEAQVGLAIAINDGHEHDGHRHDDTEMFIQMSLEQARYLGTALGNIVNTAEAERCKMLLSALEFKTAQIDCLRGAVGKLVITKVADSERSNVGFGVYDLSYIDDSGDDVMIHECKALEMYVPFMQEEQYEWLRTLVGGNHQYASEIKIQLVGFTLEEITTSFEEQLKRAVVPQ